MDKQSRIGETASPHRRTSVEDGRRKRTRLLIVLLLLLLLCGAAAAVWLAGGGGNDFFDPAARNGQAPYKSQEEMQAELDRIVEEGMFNISIASVIEFDAPSSPGKAYIENVPGNRYHMSVAITLDDTGEVLYESKGLAPGSYIEDIQLARNLEAGSHNATATFTAFDKDTFEEAGKAAAKISLVVRGGA